MEQHEVKIVVWYQDTIETQSTSWSFEDGVSEKEKIIIEQAMRDEECKMPPLSGDDYKPCQIVKDKIFVLTLETKDKPKMAYASGYKIDDFKKLILQDSESCVERIIKVLQAEGVQKLEDVKNDLRKVCEELKIKKKKMTLFFVGLVCVVLLGLLLSVLQAN